MPTMAARSAVCRSRCDLNMVPFMDTPWAVTRAMPTGSSRWAGGAGRGLARRLREQATRFVAAAGVVVAVTERHGLAELGARSGAIAGFQCQLSHLEVRAAVHPRPPFGRERGTQIRAGFS